MKFNFIAKAFFLFLFVFSLNFIGTKVSGTLGKGFNGSISFAETIDQIPEIVIFSLFVTILLSLGLFKIKKSEKK